MHLALIVRILPLALVTIAWLSASVPVARATFPGDNGKIAFVDHLTPGCASACESDVFTVDPNGTSRTNLTNRIGVESEPKWSPNGLKILFSAPYAGSNDLWVMNADGSGMTQLTTNPAAELEPAWSPDGTEIAFRTNRDGNWEIYKMSAEGTTVSRLTDDPAFDYEPAWSPDGTRIAFNRGADIYLTNANGTGEAPLAWVSDGCYISEGAEHPDWAPSAERITFIRSYETDCSFELGPAQDVVTTRANGSDFRVLGGFGFTPAYSPDGTRIVYAESGADGITTLDATDGGGFQPVTALSDVLNAAPDWQPILRGYPRPKGATPVRVPLVPALKPCTSPNRTHGAPLSYGSCAPPVPESGTVFIGIGDGNPALAKSIGSVVVRTLSGVSPDGADVGINVSITNVMKTSDRSDYAGELRLELPLRITDWLNKPHPSGNGPGTVSDTSIFATVPCSPTADTTIGSACRLTTTADSLLPATVQAGTRSIWAIGEVRLHDGGPDGDAETPTDNKLFAVQGVFAP